MQKRETSQLPTSPLENAQTRTQSQAWWRHPVINRRAWTWEDDHNSHHNGQWWQHAVIYQVSPMSFMDTDGDGRGDINGIIARLDYIASLGVDAIWLCPVFEAEMDDFGYDVTGMMDIDPLFGNLRDFDRLLDIAHTFGLKVLVDQVWNHTSDKHPWFVESRKSYDNPKADWYVWADPKDDGSPPNNWLSAFMGDSAWAWDDHRQQYYLYNFLPSQPDLNWHNPDVIDSILNRARFWLDRGIDGFRMDAVNFYVHDPELRDNPKRSEDASLPDGIDPDNPMVEYEFRYNFCRPENLDVLAEIRELVDRYPGAMMLGEVTLCEDSIPLSSQYVRGDKRLHAAYNSALLPDEPMTADFMRRVTDRVQRHFTEGGQCWMVGNHDYGRLRSRWTGKDVKGQPYPSSFYHMMAALLLCLPGGFCLYQGDELGLPEAKIPKDIPEGQIQDPFGQALYPLVPGRDGSRTPMPWKTDEPHAGFTTAEKPWLPVPKKHYNRAVDLQTHEPMSMLNTWRRLLHWRRRQPALIAGNFYLLATPESVFGFIREYAEQRLVCLFNISDESVTCELPQENYHAESVLGLAFQCDRNNGTVTLPPYGCFLASVPMACELNAS